MPCKLRLLWLRLYRRRTEGHTTIEGLYCQEFESRLKRQKADEFNHFPDPSPGDLNLELDKVTARVGNLNCHFSEWGMNPHSLMGNARACVSGCGPN